MSIFAMKNEDNKESRFFDILIQKRSYFGFLYSIVAIPIALIYFVFSLLGLIVGFALLPFWIGVPFLNFYFFLIWKLSRFEEITFEYITGISLPKITKFTPNKKTVYLNFKAYFHNKRTWKRISYFLLKIFWRIIFGIPTVVLIVLTSLLIYTPVNSVFGRIKIYTVYQTESFIEVTIIFFVCIIIWIALLNFINYLTFLSSKILKQFFSR